MCEQETFKKILDDNRCDVCGYIHTSLIDDEGHAVCKECYAFANKMLKEEREEIEEARQRELMLCVTTH